MSPDIMRILASGDIPGAALLAAHSLASTENDRVLLEAFTSESFDVNDIWGALDDWSPGDTAFSVAVLIVALTRGHYNALDFLKKDHMGAASLLVPALPDLKIGELAIMCCSLEQQKSLLNVGFLRVEDHALLGFKHHDAAISDFWSDLYTPLIAPNPKGKPPRHTAVDAALFAWLPRSTPASQDLNQAHQECLRRTSRAFNAYLSKAYPVGADDLASGIDPEFARWQKMLCSPPMVQSKYSSAQPSDRFDFARALMAHQLSKTPDALSTRFTLDIANQGGYQLARILLDLGFPLSSFEGDLIQSCLGNIAKSLNSPHNPPSALSELWTEVVRHLHQEKSRWLDVLPYEMTAPEVSIKSMIREKDKVEKGHFIEMLVLCMRTEPSHGSIKKGMRL